MSRAQDEVGAVRQVSEVVVLQRCMPEECLGAAPGDVRPALQRLRCRAVGGAPVRAVQEALVLQRGVSEERLG